jgi:hypothetical protein
LDCFVEVFPGIKIRARDVDGKVYIDSGSDQKWSGWTYKAPREEVDPFIKVEVLSPGGFKVKTAKPERLSYYSYQSPAKYEVQGVESYQVGYWADSNYAPWLYLTIRVTLESGESVEGELRFHRPFSGKVTVLGTQKLQVETNFFGLQLKWFHQVERWNDLQTAFRHLNFKNPSAAWRWFLSSRIPQATLDKIDQKGVKALEKRKSIRPNLDRLATEEPLLFQFFLWLHSGRTYEGITNNNMIATMLKTHGEDYALLKRTLQKTMDQATKVAPSPRSYEEAKDRDLEGRSFCLILPGVQEKVQEKKAQKEWHLQKTNAEKALALGVDPQKYPKLNKAIKEGKVPLILFHEPGQELHLVNVEFDLWERCLKRKGWAEIIFDIAQDASRRSTYSHQMTSFLVFLFKIEKYLDRHTEGRKKWKAFPKFVESQWELEMDDPEEGSNTTKRRSALTPIVDNQERTIHVPYVSMAVSGRRTTYCYSQHYVVFEEGLNDDYGKGVVSKDLERKLNGRDDYGLMYYTFTGTDINRGYPTFLIIFERTTEHGTRVHFHRVHPNRSKKGIYTPTCRLIQECYRYMAGNVRAEEIYAQQGDMLFIQSKEPRGGTEGAQGVKDFESHAFVTGNGSPVILVENKAKSVRNRLGHIYAAEDFTLEHPEHEDVPMSAGWYEVRRVKSWEANPTAVWSLFID